MELQKLFDMQELPGSMVKAAAKLFQSGFKAGERLGQNLSDLIDVFIDSINSNNKDYEWRCKIYREDPAWRSVHRSGQ